MIQSLDPYICQLIATIECIFYVNSLWLDISHIKHRTYLDKVIARFKSLWHKFHNKQIIISKPICAILRYLCDLKAIITEPSDVRTPVCSRFIIYIRSTPMNTRQLQKVIAPFKSC